MISDGATNLVERIEIVSVEAVEDSVSDVVNYIPIIKKKLPQKNIFSVLV